MNLRERILKLLGQKGYQPLDKVGLTKALQVAASERRRVREVLRELEVEGAIVSIRKGFYVLPDTADLVTGVVHVFPSGNARLEVSGRKAKEVRIASGKLGVAMHRDRVVARWVRVARGARVGGSQGMARGAGKLGVRGRGAVSAPGDAGEVEVEVIRILERANATVVGTLRQTRGFLHVVPDDARLLHDIYLRQVTETERGAGKGVEAKVGDKVVIALDPWESAHQSPEGILVERLGAADAPGVDMLSILRKHRLPLEFPEEVEREAARFSEVLGAKDWKGREDFRGQPALTIDPDDAKDFDDAVHVERRDAGGWLLSVHIADVAHYVRRGSALDREARRRGNSTYLVDRVIPMLPERLSNGICSLKPGVERLAFSAFLEFNSQGKLRGARFARTVIRSVARLTYRQAFAILEGKVSGGEGFPLPVPGSLPVGDPVVVERVRAAWELATVLRRNRFQAGSLDLDFPEVKVWLDAEGRADRMEKVENDRAHQLIEECMLAANEAVAAALKRSKAPAVYRVHEVPDPERLKEFREKAQAHGVRVGDLTQRREVEKLLKAIRGRPEEYVVKLDFLKSLKRASYDVKPLGHYGLAKMNYTHFTSPIRRYADLLVHRALAGEHASKPGELGEAAMHISQTERKSAEAEKDSVQLKKVEFFERQLRPGAGRKPMVFRAVVVEVRGHGLVVELPDVLMTGMIHVSALPGDFYLFDEGQRCFRGRRTRRRFALGMELEVRVSRVDVQKRYVDFDLAEA